MGTPGAFGHARCLGYQAWWYDASGETLVLFQCDNYGFSDPVVFRSKAQCEANGRSLVKHWNAAAGHHRVALRVILSMPTDCVPSLGKGATIACEARLVVSIDKITELAIITLKEH